MPESENIRRIREGYAAARRGDLAALRELLDPDVRWHGGDPHAPEACRGREQALWFIGRPGRGPIPELIDAREAGDQIVIVLRRTGEDGRPECVANLTTMRDGRVVEMVHHADVGAALAAAGIGERA